MYSPVAVYECIVSKDCIHKATNPNIYIQNNILNTITFVSFTTLNHTPKSVVIYIIIYHKINILNII